MVRDATGVFAVAEPQARVVIVKLQIRKIVHGVEETWHDGGPPRAAPVAKGWIAAAVANPYAGRYVEELEPSLEELKSLGIDLSKKLAELLGGADHVDAYGKGAIVGSAGEVEHSALWHVPGGYAMRGVLGKALAIVPSAVKMGGFGTTLDVPLHHKDACYVRSHFDAVTMMMTDGPRPDEIVFVLAMARGGRPHARMGGLTADEISTWDGQR